MKRFTLLSYSLLTATLLAACGDDPEPAKFSTATDLQKQRAITAGAGMDAGITFLFGSLLSSLPPESACPTIAAAGDTLTITGNCTDENGDKWLGTLSAKNVPGFFGGPEADPTKPSVVTADGFGIDDTSDENQDILLDGVVTLEPGGETLVADLDATLGGVAVHSDATWRRAGERSTADEGSFIDVLDLGAADIKGSWNMDSEAPAGVLELHGDDVLKADFGAMVDGCVPLTVDGAAAGQLCESENGL